MRKFQKSLCNFGNKHKIVFLMIFHQGTVFESFWRILFILRTLCPFWRKFIISKNDNFKKIPVVPKNHGYNSFFVISQNPCKYWVFKWCAGTRLQSLLQYKLMYSHPGYGIKIFLNSAFTFFSLAFLPV